MAATGRGKKDRLEDNMDIIPSIHIRNGCSIKIQHDNYHAMEIFRSSPVKAAQYWEGQGAKLLHIVDMDGVFVGHLVNEDAIRSICETVSIPIQVGGGLRTIKSVENVLSLGAQCAVIGTKAVENPLFIRDLLHVFPSDRIIVSIDAINGMVTTEGWAKLSSFNAVNMARTMRSYGVKKIVYTDIDSILNGPNIEHIREILGVGGIEVMVAGGISSKKELELIDSINAPGVIVGKALYDGSITLPEALATYCYTERQINLPHSII